jgi:hypothetical protein
MDENEEFEFRMRHEAELAAAKPPKVAKVADLPQKSLMDRAGEHWGNFSAGAVRGAGSIGSTILWPVDAAIDAIKGDRQQTVEGLIRGTKPMSRHEETVKRMNLGLQDLGFDTDSKMFGAGKITGEIAGTAGAGGALGNGVARAAPLLTRLGASAPAIANTVSTLASNGMRAGNLTGKAAMAARVAGGAASGGAGAAMIDPKNAGTGALIGGALPPVLKGIGATAGYTGKVLKSVVQPFTSAGQKDIAGGIIRKFAQGGPTALNSTEIVPGSLPTLAEATGNAGLAGLQRGARAVNQNAFVAREQANAAARNAVFDEAAGDAGKLDYFRASRADAAGDLYSSALAGDASANMTPYLKGQITQLLKRPSIDEASRVAQKWAIERGEKPAMAGSLQALHDVKTALDDKIAAAVRDNQGGQVKALEGTKAKLLDVMEKLSPGYKEARVTYAEMSKPISALESLQKLKLSDAQGNMTLSKVKNGIEGLNRAREAPGIHPAKSIDPGQMGALQSIHDDLLRQSNLSLGKAAGSDTFQNIATDNVLGSLLPGKAGQFVVGKAGHLLGQVGRLAYSGPNEAIRAQLLDMMLDPNLAKVALNPRLGGKSALTRLLESQQAEKAQKLLHRSAPPLLSDQ